MSELCLMIEIELTPFEGPSHGRPMQLRSMDEGRGEIEREQLTATTINSTNGKGKARAASRRSECLAYSSCLISFFSHQRLTCEKFSASSVVPTRRAAPVPVQRVHPLPHQHFDSALTGDGGNNADSDDSGAETEKEWLDESDLAKLALRFPDNVSEAMAIEVRNDFFFSFFLTSGLYRTSIEAVVAGPF